MLIQDGGEVWADSTAIGIPVGPNTSELRYHKSSAMHLWLFEYELPDTVMALTKTALHFVTSSKKGERAVASALHHAPSAASSAWRASSSQPECPAAGHSNCLRCEGCMGHRTGCSSCSGAF